MKYFKNNEDGELHYLKITEESSNNLLVEELFRSELSTSISKRKLVGISLEDYQELIQTWEWEYSQINFGEYEATKIEILVGLS